MLSIVLAIAGGSGLVEAETAFARRAQHDGQWTAFRATAARDAIIFVPEPVPALDWLADKKDPPTAVRWQPASAFLSCDGKTGATIGPWQRPTSVGYFVTVWTRGKSGWKWQVDFGEQLDKPWQAGEDATTTRASCAPLAAAKIPAPLAGAKSDHGASRDGSLQWAWTSDGPSKSRIIVYLWNGANFDTVIDRASAPE